MIDLPERKYPLKRSKHSNHDKPDDKKFHQSRQELDQQQRESRNKVQNRYWTWK